MPKGIYNTKCTEEKKGVFTPTKHQTDTLKAFLKSKYKGMLLYHKLGSGKTCTSIMIADEMLKRKKVNKVFVLSPGSLRSGWVEEYCQICGDNKKLLESKYTFITYNYMVGNNLPDFNNSLVIIDEVHNLINGVKNLSKHPVLIYDKLILSDCCILALSGTPVYNYVYEFALLGNLLKPGGEFPDLRKGTDIDSFIFMNLFDISDDGTLKPKNKTTMKRKLEGIISYYPGAGAEFVPEIKEMEPIKAVMTKDQEINYWEQKLQEDRLSKPPSKHLKVKDPKKYEELSKLYVMAKKNILSRKASNFFYPDDISKESDLPLKMGGWVKKTLFSDGELYSRYSTKFTALLLNIVMHLNEKHVLFTSFKNKSGVYLLKTILGMCGIRSEIFSGDLDDSQRKNILKNFNSPKNIHGDVIKVLLVTEAGAEGISILDTRHMHILESSNRMSRTIQAIGRVARFKSHMRLPLEDRNVKVWRYWSIGSPNDITVSKKIIDSDGKEEKVNITISDKKTIDELLYEKGMKTIRGVNSFLDILKNASVTPY